MNHTKGPWSYIEKTSFFGVKASNPFVIVHCVNSSREERKANAQLISLAPEMLEQLQNVVKQAEYNPFLSVGMLLEHHSKIKEILKKIKEFQK